MYETHLLCECCLPLPDTPDPSIFLTHLAARVAPRLASKVFDAVGRHRGEHRGNLCLRSLRGCPLYITLSFPHPFVSVRLSLPANEPCRTAIILCSHVETQREQRGVGGGVERKNGWDSVRERGESWDMMFSLTSSLIRTVFHSKHHTAIRPDSTPTPTIPPGLHVQTLK